jgi:hypothetical protein
MFARPLLGQGELLAEAIGVDDPASPKGPKSKKSGLSPTCGAVTS